jgi:hypothetical protein
MSGVGFVNAHNIRSIIVKGLQPVFFLLCGPGNVNRRDIIISFVALSSKGPGVSMDAVLVDSHKVAFLQSSRALPRAS